MLRFAPAPVALFFGILAAPVAAQADIYSWVDAQGNLHFSNVKNGSLPSGAAVMQAYDGEDAEYFGGEPPLILVLENGEKRTLYKVDVDRYDAIFRRAAEHYNLPFAFLKAVAKVESNFNPHAISRADAKGLMQLMDGTAALLGVTDAFEPEQAIFGGARYLRMLANMFDGDLTLTTAAYNAGPERVKKSRGVPKIEETQRYVERVLQIYRHYRGREGEKEG